MKKNFLTAITCLFFIVVIRAQGDPAITEAWNPVPKVISPGAKSSDAPSDAIVLFDGKNTSSWTQVNGKDFNWKVDSGFMMVNPGTGDIKTKQGFGSCQLHIEWRTPFLVKGQSQGRGNSGIFLMGHYEVQVLDNFNNENKTYVNGQAGSMYKQSPPLVNVCKAPGEWQTYDIIFTAPRFSEKGGVIIPAKITVIQNGVLVQNNTTIWGTTFYIGSPTYEQHEAKEPISIQDHGHLTSFRNIWVREL